jgi:hypothetical protein
MWPNAMIMIQQFAESQFTLMQYSQSNIKGKPFQIQGDKVHVQL